MDSDFPRRLRLRRVTAMAFHSGLHPESAIARPVAHPAIDLASVSRFLLCPAKATVDWAADVHFPGTAMGSRVPFVLAVSVARFSPEAGPVCPRVFRSARFRRVCFGRAIVVA